VGEGGSEYHRAVALPTVLDLLQLKADQSVLDVGAGQGVLAPYVVRVGATYTGVDASPRLLELARKRHSQDGSFLLGDARALPAVKGLHEAAFDAVVFLLSLQDMDPLDDVLAGAAWALKQGGCAVLLLTHPAFRIPRQSGWGWDENRKLVYRRIDRYLTPLPVPLKPYPGRDVQGVTRSFHRPLKVYINSLSAHGLLTDRMEEVPAHKLTGVAQTPKAENLARKEIPLFLGLRSRKI
jgi:SAM-dependent methyltransferase